MLTKGRAGAGADRSTAVALAIGGALLLAAAAASLRLVGIGLPPLAFHGDRQLYGTLMARGFWASMGGSLPQGTSAAVSASQSPVIEPPLVQGAAAVSYLATGGEHVALVRTALALLWVATAPVVFGLTRRLVDRWAGWVAAAVWLFAPFGVVLSRSFQPDGPMVCGLAVTLWSAVRDDDDGRRAPGWRTIGIAAFAILIKPTVGLLVVPALVALPLARSGPRALRDVRLWVRVAVSTLPAAAYLAIGAATDLLAGQGDQRFAPRAWLEWSTWTGWWDMVTRVVAPGVLLLAALGIAMGPRRARALVGAVVAGYLVQCFAFAHHTATHDYYHAVLLPLAAVGLGAFASMAARALAGRVTPWLVAGSVAAVVLLALVAGPMPYPYVERSLPDRLAAMPPAAAAAGEALNHSDRVVFISRGYGTVQQFYGYLAGPAWPLQGDLDTDALFGGRPIGATERLEKMDADGGTLEWALVTEPAVLSEQPDLAALLSSHFCPGPSGAGWTAYRRC